MKKKIKCLISIILSLVVIIGTAMVATAVEPRFSDTNFVDVQLIISGTTAYCTVNVTGADGTKSITDGHVTLKDSKGNVLGDWTDLSSNNEVFSDFRTVTNLVKGETYTLSFTATVNGKNGSKPVTGSRTKTC